jgi:hypothetical protein
MSISNEAVCNLLRRALEALGRFTTDEGWTMDDIETMDAIDAALTRLTDQPAADQPRACSYTNPCWADDCGACGSRSPTAVQPNAGLPPSLGGHSCVVERFGNGICGVCGADARAASKPSAECQHEWRPFAYESYGGPSDFYCATCGVTRTAVKSNEG